ncbi:hypothetical protein IC006_2597 [Sulfuracidifex tepidarius]|uniref:Uncharacterized protein n=1 Tax=Sulfuracidifex tepidarius TaxID=1294262 RepID=A0A510DYF4_9CREN|nr:hypothetical protein IC006_2597 [Sulfuracidifex tepidarius]BBG28056.1 hypothetical protein IC007_2611 [Sulfuracidifex tepidarius]
MGMDSTSLVGLLIDLSYVAMGLVIFGFGAGIALWFLRKKGRV